MIFKPLFLSTGIGSLPFDNPAEAHEVIKKYFPRMPHWAQLPKSGPREGFVEQFIYPLVKLGLVEEKDGRAYFLSDDPKWADNLTEFYNVYLAAAEGDEGALNFFAFPEESAKGFYFMLKDFKKNGTGQAEYLKGQVSGPLTVGFRLTNPKRQAAYYDHQLRDIIVKTLILQSLWQAKTLSEFGLPVVLFIDDPGLYAYGLSTHITLKREDIKEDIKAVIKPLHDNNVLTGIHVCAGMDWSILLESSVDIISFDAYEYFTSMSSYTTELKNFLTRGGVIAWGLVPTSDKVLEENKAALVERFKGYIRELENKGISRKILKEQALLTPSCGTGTLKVDVALRVLELTRSLSDEILTLL